ncbi:radical SAM protein [Paenibacillus sp. 19GGS1-52]|uniref:radical SAM protein n=1 Tax=Paenibacillus sp. 19GGS1-52 TaxID=2758563 RepID=UPI001EFB2384|nr:radical SAM protein [Paenibacillus sp. 19GGS1-52]ULO05926.1 radical SAM protein [Paenibacillus sp. 19GGS1-52]
MAKCAEELAVGIGYLLRIGVTPQCNYRCVYCNPEGECGQKNDLTSQDLIEILTISAELGIKDVHITGGEPLLLPSLVEVLRTVKNNGHHLNYYLTTNGSLLYKYAEDLSEVGVKRVNISVDSINPDIFHNISQTDHLEKVLRGIAISKSVFESIKINMVVLRRYNFNEILTMIEFCQEHEIILRLMELLPFSTSEQPGDFFLDNHVSKRELEEFLQKELGSLMPANNVKGNNWACDYWTVNNYKTPIAIVYHHTRGYFCVKQNCKSLRISPGGDLAACYTAGFPTINIANSNYDEKLDKFLQSFGVKRGLEDGSITYPSYHIPDYKAFRANIK